MSEASPCRQAPQLLALARVATWGSPLSLWEKREWRGVCGKGRGAGCFGDWGQPGRVGGGVPCPEKHLIQEPGQELTHPLPVSSPSAPGASGF